MGKLGDLLKAGKHLVTGGEVTVEEDLQDISKNKDVPKADRMLAILLDNQKKKIEERCEKKSVTVSEEIAENIDEEENDKKKKEQEREREEKKKRNEAIKSQVQVAKQTKSTQTPKKVNKTIKNNEEIKTDEKPKDREREN